MMSGEQWHNMTPEQRKRATQRAMMRNWSGNAGAVKGMFNWMLSTPVEEGGFTEAEISYFKLLERMFTALDPADNPEDDDGGAWARKWAA